MGEKIWYTYDQSKQEGPFDLEEITTFLSQKKFSEGAFLFKAGWKDWKPLKECLSELLPPPPVTPPVPQMPKTRQHQQRDDRGTISGKIIIHNNGQLLFGSGVNISTSGIFVETKERLFSVGETLKLTCRIDAISTPFNVCAVVKRFNEDEQYPIGYGLQFVDLDQNIKQDLSAAIKAKAR